jgi:adenylate cyclase
VPEEESTGEENPDSEASDAPGASDAEQEDVGRSEQRARRIAEGATRIDSAPGLVRAAKNVREMLPGDAGIGDSLSSDGRPSDLLARALAAEPERPSTARQLGLAAVQVFQALGDAKSRASGERELAIVFTDLVAYSSWALDAGDEEAIQLLRQVADVVEPLIAGHGGEVVKRMGDGYMAVFADADSAVAAALEANEQVASLRVGGYDASQRAGVHMGTPRRVGRDYLGVDVNIAARVAEAASGGEVLVSGAVGEALDGGQLKLRKRRFKAKGVPKGFEVYEVSAG